MPASRKKLIQGVMPFLLLLAFAVRAQAQRLADVEQSKEARGIKSAFREVVAPAAMSTVVVLCDGKQVALGTIITTDGYVLTKASELSDHITCRLRNGNTFAAKLVGVAENCDLAMLKGEAWGLIPVHFGNGKEAAVGEWVATAGASASPVAVGVISVGPRRITGRNAMLGVTLEETPNGAKVVSIFPNSGAEKAGIKVNDLITSLAGIPTPSRDQLTELLQTYRLGDNVAVHVKRGEQELDVTATLGKRPQDPPSRADMMNALGGPLSHRATGFPLVLQHDTVLKPEQCGGPLVDLDGHVIGINIARAGRTESYALPSEVVVGLIEDLKAGKYPATTQPTTQPTSQPAKHVAG